MILKQIYCLYEYFFGIGIQHDLRLFNVINQSVTTNYLGEPIN